jgi:hypothetical protein
VLPKVDEPMARGVAKSRQQQWCKKRTRRKNPYTTYYYHNYFSSLTVPFVRMVSRRWTMLWMMVLYCAFLKGMMMMMTTTMTMHFLIVVVMVEHWDETRVVVESIHDESDPLGFLYFGRCSVKKKDGELAGAAAPPAPP